MILDDCCREECEWTPDKGGGKQTTVIHSNLCPRRGRSPLSVKRWVKSLNSGGWEKRGDGRVETERWEEPQSESERDDMWVMTPWFSANLSLPLHYSHDPTRLVASTRLGTRWLDGWVANWLANWWMDDWSAVCVTSFCVDGRWWWMIDWWTIRDAWIKWMNKKWMYGQHL